MRAPIGSPAAMNAEPPTSPPDEIEDDESDCAYERDYEPEPPDRDEAKEWGGC